MSIVDQLEETMGTQGSRGEGLRQSILKWAFEGKLADQDPTDEPGSVLLERIRAERAADQSARAKRQRGAPRSVMARGGGRRTRASADEA